jgi:hypothetical protein
MKNINKWIPTSQAYPPDGAEIEVLIDEKIFNAIFHDYEDCRVWTIKRDEYDGFLLPTAWRFPEDTIAIVLKVDLLQKTSQELGI